MFQHFHNVLGQYHEAPIERNKAEFQASLPRISGGSDLPRRQSGLSRLIGGAQSQSSAAALD